MVSREALKEQFSNMGATLTDPVLTKCEELCLAYAVDEEEMAETWTAFSCSKSIDIDPTLDALGQMERVEFGKRTEASASTPVAAAKRHASLVVYNSSETAPHEHFEDEILSTYNVTPKAKSVRCAQNGNTPNRNSSPRAQILSPASFSPLVSTPSARYASRSNSGSILCSLGDIQKASWFAGTFKPNVFTVLSVPNGARYMFDTLKERAVLLDDNLRTIAASIFLKAGINNSSESATSDSNLENYGRICATGDELTFENVMVETSGENGVSVILPFNVKSIPKLSVFPGQVVAYTTTAKGVPNSVLANEIFYDGSLPLSDAPLEFENEGPLQIVVASGPYTQKDTMAYQPLADLTDYIKKHKPHIVILIGPFIDADHEHVKDGLMAETFDDFFDKQISFISKSLEGMNTKIIIAASSRDAHHQPIFPTPAYVVKKNLPHLLSVGDPCILNIDGLMVGITSTDILQHMSKVELFDHVNSQDRMGRLSRHVIFQQNFYPLYPPSDHINMDMNLWYEYCNLPFTPHILVLPSDLRGFIKVECDCVVINPEHLAKGYVGGTFAHVEVKSSFGKWDPSCVTCKVIKI